MKVDEVTTTGNFPKLLVPLGRPVPYHDYYQALGKGAKKKKRKKHPLIKWDDMMKDYPKSSLWYA